MIKANIAAGNDVYGVLIFIVFRRVGTFIYINAKKKQRTKKEQVYIKISTV